MDILKAEASRAKAEALSVNRNKTGGKKRYLRRGEVDRLKKEVATQKVCVVVDFFLFVVITLYHFVIEIVG